MNTNGSLHFPQLRHLENRHGLSQALLARLCEALAEAMQPTFVGQWLDQPNEMLGGLKPIEAIERGQIDLVWQVVEGLRSGAQL